MSDSHDMAILTDGSRLAEELSLVCCQCEEALAGEERETPYIRDGEVWCDECYHEAFEFPCCWCEEYGDIEDQHRYVVVFDPQEVRLPLAGLYRVVRRPYYTHAILDAWLHPWALQWLGQLPPGLQEDPDRYPVGHLCADCQRAMLADIAIRQRIIHDVA